MKPEFEAVRGLVARGVTGRLEVSRLFTEEFQPDAVFGERRVNASG